MNCSSCSAVCTHCVCVTSTYASRKRDPLILVRPSVSLLKWWTPRSLSQKRSEESHASGDRSQLICGIPPTLIVVMSLLWFDWWTILCVVDYWTCPSNAIDKVGVRISRYVEVPSQLICVVIIFVVLFLLLVFLPSSTPESLTPSLLVPWHFDWFAIDLFVDAVVLVNVNGRHEELIDTSSLLCWFDLYCLLLC